MKSDLIGIPVAVILIFGMIALGLWMQTPKAQPDHAPAIVSKPLEIWGTMQPRERGFFLMVDSNGIPVGAGYTIFIHIF